MPIPMAARMNNGIHRALHGIEVINLVKQRLIVDTTNMWIKRTKESRHVRAYSMYCMLTKIKIFGKVRWGNIGSISWVILHLFIPALHSIGSTICNILQDFRIIQRSTFSLASCNKYTDSLTMFIRYGCF